MPYNIQQGVAVFKRKCKQTLSFTILVGKILMLKAAEKGLNCQLLPWVFNYFLIM